MSFFSYKRNKHPAIASAADLPSGAHLNFMGGVSYDVTDPIVRLRLAAASCFFGEPMYYHRDEADPRPSPAKTHGALSEAEITYLRATLGAIDPASWRSLTPSGLMESAIDEALDADPEATLDVAVKLRQAEHIRTTPQVILVRAAHHPKVRGTGLVRKYAPRIVARADEPAVGLAYQMARYGKPIPNALKKAWRDRLGKASAYELAKHRLDSRVAKTVDVVNLVHPASQAVDALAKGRLSNDESTWEAIVSKKGASRASWSKAVKVMGHLALLRNLRNLLQHEVPVTSYLPRFEATASEGKALPFRYASAWQAVNDLGARDGASEVKAAIERCLMTSLHGLPRFRGRLTALADNSGSAQRTTTSSLGTMKASTIGNLTAILAALCADKGSVGIFGDRLEMFDVGPKANVFELLAKAEHEARTIGESTENGIWLFWDKAIREKQIHDHVIVMSDMQAGHGGLYGTDPKSYKAFAVREREKYIDVAKLVRHYREKVNPGVMVYLVQIAGYQNTLVPELYDRTFILGGWGEGILRYAAEMAAIAQ